MYSRLEDESEIVEDDADDDSLVAARIPFATVTPIPHVLDLIVSPAETLPAEPVIVKSGKAPVFPLLPAVGGGSVHVNVVTSRFHMQHKGIMFAATSTNRLQRVRSDLLLNDPLPVGTVHEFCFVALRLDAALFLARIQAGLSWKHRTGGPRSVPFPIPAHVEKSDAVSARCLLFDPPLASLAVDTTLSLSSALSSDRPDREDITFRESFAFRVVDITANTVVALLSPDQYRYDARTHDVSMARAVWDRICALSACEPAAASPTVAASEIVSTRSRANNHAPATAVSSSAEERKRTVNGQQQLIDAGLIPSDVDCGYSFSDFEVGQPVMAHFEVGPIAGIISARSPRNKTFKLILDTDLWDKMVVVSHRSIEPLSGDIDDDDNDDDERDDDGEIAVDASSASSFAVLGRRNRQAEPAAISLALLVGDTVFVSAPNATETYQVKIIAVDDKVEAGFGSATYTYCNQELHRRYGAQTSPLAYFTRVEPIKRSRRRTSALDSGDYETY